jgi:hypothetical protein
MEDGAPANVAEARDRFESILFSCELSLEESDSDEGDGDANDGDGDGEGGGEGGGGGGGKGIYAELHAAISRAMQTKEDPEDYVGRVVNAQQRFRHFLPNRHNLEIPEPPRRQTLVLVNGVSSLHAPNAM